MPWTESVAMEKRERFVRDALSERYTMSELCARYGVSRRVGYVWPGEVHSCQCIGDEHQYAARCASESALHSANLEYFTWSYASPVNRGAIPNIRCKTVSCARC